MSIVTVQLGQCGNQLGCQLFEMLNDEVPEWGHEREHFFRRESGTERGLARTVLVDMEPKVVNACLRKGSRPSTKWAYNSSNVIIQQSGSGALSLLSDILASVPVKGSELQHDAMKDTSVPRATHTGNNWALGYHHHGSRCMEAVMDRVRSEVEQCDYFGGLLLLQSLAGGTGAGLGSRVAEELNMHFPSALQLSYAVWPYDAGEVLVQAYNTVLSVNKLLATCDGVIITRNEDLAATCSVRAVSQPCYTYRSWYVHTQQARLLLQLFQISYTNNDISNSSCFRKFVSQVELATVVTALCQRMH